MAPRAEKIEKLAKKQVGYLENPAGSNKTKYGAAYGADGYPWCAGYQWWLEERTGPLTFVKTLYTPTLAQWFIDAGRWSEKPVRGALVFFNFPDSLDRIQHVGRVIAVGKSAIRTNEGNTSSGNAGSQDNGGGVFERLRAYGDYIVGYGLPTYLEKPDKKAKPKQRADLRRGDKGADVRTWQKDLNAARIHLPPSKAWAEVEVSGEFGAETVKATKALERALGLPINGRVTVHDILIVERKLRRAA